ncbi:MAG TPA: GDSL-type esterase/lipase family protein [Mycobacteriales bacterium]|nr:GDSL-type esterase/lipase family protein [Mycobacteriales bacterium]
MKVFRFDDPLVAIHGAADFDRTEGGISPRRLPAWTRIQVPDALSDVASRMPAGCYVALRTTATVIELDARTMILNSPPTAPRPAVFDLVVDGRIADSVAVTDGDRLVVRNLRPLDVSVERGALATVRFADLPPGVKDLEIWLPHNATVELRELRLDDDASLEPRLPDTRKVWAHYGSSISHCLEVPRPTDVWPAQVARSTGLSLIDLGFGGSCHLDQYAARTIRDLAADVITLKVGINVSNGDTMRERAFVPAVHGFLDTIREAQPDVAIVVISPIICPPAEDHPGPASRGPDGSYQRVERPDDLMTGALTLQRMRELLEAAVASRQGQGDANLHYLGGLALFGAPDAHLLPDDLHPSPEGYRMIGERFTDLVFGPDGLLRELGGF